MRMILGGAAQGKLAYALAQTGLGMESVCDGGSCPLDRLPDAPVVYRLHLLIRRLMQAGMDPAEFVSALARQNPRSLLVTDEVGCGIVPVEPFERAWREAVGRICCALARDCQRVERVYAGLPVLLKGEAP